MRIPKSDARAVPEGGEAIHPSAAKEKARQLEWPDEERNAETAIREAPG
jgi:hypothetical protein